MNIQEFKAVILAEAAKANITEFELYYQNGSSTSISAFNGEINEFSSSEEGGVCFRCKVDGKMGYASTEALSTEEAVGLIKRAAANAVSLETDDPAFLGEAGKTYEKLELVPMTLPSTEELIQTALDTQKEVISCDEASTPNGVARTFSETMSISIFNSNGLDLYYENTGAGAMAMAVTTDGKEMTNSYEIKLGELNKIDTHALAKKAVDNAKSKLGATVAPTAVCPVVFSADAMTSLLSTYSGIFSSENTQKGLSLLAGKEGTAIAAPMVTLMDDPFYKDSAMPINFDAEGSPSYCKKVIENGVLNTLLYNMKTAAIAGRETTGNASKAGYNSDIGIHPFTMYLAPGTESEEELFAKAGNGVYITSLGGLHAGANTISGDFSLQSSGFMIENGKKTYPVKSFTVAGNFYDLLNKITALSDKVELPFPGGITSFGSPAVLVSEMSIAGK
ncbi:MAG: TldD/PmbA family protein [Lachnospiraceae bacterium]|nr:TldD/PmbA family protein [Lachnospiraceae bacterium]